jgi:DNA-binding PadR family transcriptional regulator
VIDSHMGTSVQLKKTTAYDLLRKMARNGWIRASEERERNRPPRRVYTITSEGEAEFQRMLRESLATYVPAEFPADIGLAFLDALPADEALSLLQQRRAALLSLLDMATATDEHPGSMQLVVDHQRWHFKAELEWLDTVIQRINERQ